MIADRKPGGRLEQLLAAHVAALTVLGALIVGVFRNGLQLMGVESNYQVLITGVLVILAVSVDALSHRSK